MVSCRRCRNEPGVGVITAAWPVCARCSDDGRAGLNGRIRISAMGKARQQFFSFIPGSQWKTGQAGDKILTGTNIGRY